MKTKTTITGLTCLLIGAASSFNLTAAPALGLKFAATTPDAANSTLLATDSAGFIPQINWNNLSGATGTDIGSLNYDDGGTVQSSTVRLTWTANGVWNSGANNLFPAGSGDRKLYYGYLDTSNTATTGVNLTVNNIDSVFTSGGYDVYVYFVSDSNANRGGAYTLNDGTQSVVKYGSTLGSPSTHIEDPGTDNNLTLDGTYLRFRRLTGSSFTLRTDTTLTTPNGTRAPVNGIQIVPTPQVPPTFTTQPVSVELYAGRTARFSAVVDAYPALTSVKWQKGGQDVVDDARISGATTPNLVIQNVGAGDVGDYTFVAVNPLDTATSEPAHLGIVTVENSPYITSLLAAGPLAHWRLNEPQEEPLAFDYVGGLTGSYESVVYGPTIDGPRPTDFGGFAADNSSVQLSGSTAAGRVFVPTPNLGAAIPASFVAWINPAVAQTPFTGIIMTRTGTSAGFGYGNDNQLGYTWNNNNGATFNWASGLRPPDNQWSMVVLTIGPNRATIYLANGGTISAAVNQIPHIAQAWGGQGRIGDDTPGGANRVFNGKIDELAIFGKELTFEEVSTLYGAAVGTAPTPKPSISPQPVSTTRYPGATVNFNAQVASVGTPTFQWKKGTTVLVDDTRITGSQTLSLTIANITAADAGDYILEATNPNGTTASTPGTLTVLPVPNAFVAEVIGQNPLSYWRLNENLPPFPGPTPALDVWGGRNGTYGPSAQNLNSGIAGPRPADGFGVLEEDNGALRSTINLANSWAPIPALSGVAVNTMTFVAMINPVSRVNNSGIIFFRNGQPATGMILAGAGNLGYSWLDQAPTYSFNSLLTPPLNQWSLVAVAVEPTKATVIMINGEGVKSAVNTTTHNVRTFSDTGRIGNDQNNNNRTFDGRIDEVMVFDKVLTVDDLNRFYQRALGSVPPTIAGHPVSVEAFERDTVRLAVSAVGTPPLTYKWEKIVDGVPVLITDAGKYSGATTGTLTITGLSATEAGEYLATVSNALGSAPSQVATVTVNPAPPIPGPNTFGSVALANGPLAYYRLNETANPAEGPVVAYEHVNGFHGRYGAAALTGVVGPRAPFPFEEANTAAGTVINTPDSWPTIPILGASTDTMTIVAWIRPTTSVINAGIVFWRLGGAATGINLGGSGNLGYHWNDVAATYNWNSGLTPPLDEWSMVAVVVEPTQATGYLVTAAGVQSAVNTTPHAVRAFTDEARIGNDPNNVNRTFDGAIDEVAIFNKALTAAQIRALASGGAVVEPPTGLAIVRNANGSVTISWNGAGKLTSTGEIGTTAEWVDVPTGGSSPVTIFLGEGAGNRFFRVEAPGNP